VCACVCVRAARQERVAINQGYRHQGLVGARQDSRPQRDPVPAGQGAHSVAAARVALRRQRPPQARQPAAAPRTPAARRRHVGASHPADTGGCFCAQGGLDLKQAPGWGSLLPTTKLGVDAGLQCPMCGTGGGWFQLCVRSAGVGVGDAGTHERQSRGNAHSLACGRARVLAAALAPSFLGAHSGTCDAALSAASAGRGEAWCKGGGGGCLSAEGEGQAHTCTHTDIFLKTHVRMSVHADIRMLAHGSFALRTCAGQWGRAVLP